MCVCVCARACVGVCVCALCVLQVGSVRPIVDLGALPQAYVQVSVGAQHAALLRSDGRVVAVGLLLSTQLSGPTSGLGLGLGEG